MTTLFSPKKSDSIGYEYLFSVVFVNTSAKGGLLGAPSQREKNAVSFCAHARKNLCRTPWVCYPEALGAQGFGVLRFPWESGF
jgi:hypothetical protein